jgi:thiamine-monophosphate kinase
MSEFSLIDGFVELLPHRKSPQGPGDDAAVIGDLCVTTDALVEGVHFKRPPFTLVDVGHKALAVNLSDLAAMGAKPAWWLCAMGLPSGFSRRDLRRIAGGMRPLAQEYGLQLVGGNLTSSPVLSLTLTVAGHARTPLLRSGARPGDVLFVAGALGKAVNLRSRAQKRPIPLVREGIFLRSYANACIDVSDGILQDLSHLLFASGVGAELDGRTIPERTGEDYALLFSVPPKRVSSLERRWYSPAPLRKIGRVAHTSGIRIDGVRVEPTGFDHFRQRSK